MKRIVLGLFALLPTAALADFDCTIERQCGGGTCEPFTGGPMLLHEAGDVWQVQMGDQKWEGYATTTVESGEISIVIPPVDGMSALVSVYPSGQAAFTVHALSGEDLVAITGSGTCAGEGG